MPRSIRLIFKFIFIYVVIIFGFAGIYRFLLNDSFYQANPETDPSFSEQVGGLLSRICSFVNVSSKPTLRWNECFFDLKEAQIEFISKNKIILSDSVSTAAGYSNPTTKRAITAIIFRFVKFEGIFVYFRIYYPTRNLESPSTGSGEGDGDLVRVDINKFEMDNSIELEVINPSSSNQFFVPNDQPEVLNFTEYLSRYRGKYRDGIYHYQLKPPILRLVSNTPDDYLKNFKHFLIDKRPIQETSFMKMLYFSGVTAATIGYGDIVPVSSIARILAALEAVIGIVLLGYMGASLYSEMHNE